MKNLEGKRLAIMQLLDREYFFRVPEYQRPFSWEQEHFQALIQDLLDAKKDQDYFLGTIVVHKKEDENISDIVDGQQRLTTLMILFACLRDLIVDTHYKKRLHEKIIEQENRVDGIPEKVRIEVKDREIFNELIVSEDGTSIPKKKSELPEPQWRYVEGIEVFKSKLSNLSQNELKKFVEFISQNCVVIILSTTTFDDAFKLFTIVNDRGKQLRRMDVLKANNIAPNIIQSDRIRNSLAQKWEEWERTLDEDTFESVLYLLRFIILEEKPYNDLLYEYEKKIFDKQKLIKGEPFFDTVFNYCAIYNEIFEDFTYFDEHPNKNRINSLLFIMKNGLRSNEWKACLMQYVKKFKDENIEKFLNLLELKYLEGWLTGLYKDVRTIAFGKVMETINKANNSLEVVNSDSLVSDIDKMKSELEGNIYGKSYAKYILLRLELLTSEHCVEHKFNAKSIEHVLPQTIDDESKWSNWYNEETHKKWVNKISNLVLLSKSKNSAAKNYDFEKKKNTYFETRVSDYPRSQEILLYTEWTPKELEIRQNKSIEKIFNDIFA
jgi:uncharacterized protein with ParB-like and HNH nuclease domain